MVSKIRAYLLEKNIISGEHSILCAVSGGIDSMVMLDCLREAGFNLGVIHINHRTRGDDNQKDYSLIKKYTDQFEIPLWYIELDKALSTQSNFQENARNLRYHHFIDVANTNGFSYIATAHHKDDDIETFFINLIRGTGITGLTGIPFKRENIIRPLKCIGKADIIKYSEINTIDYLEDSSNNTDKYLRNSLRRKVIPLLEDLAPRSKQGIINSISLLGSSSNLLQELIIDKYLEQTDSYIRADIQKIKSNTEAITILLNLFGQYGFNANQMADILSSDKSGARIESNTHLLVRDRQHFCLLEKKNEFEEVFIDSVGEYPTSDGRVIVVSESTEEKNTYWFDSNPFPLIIRARRTGDTFRPSGMQGRSKTIKKFLTDAKLSALEKSKACIVCQGKFIIGVLDHRISNQCKYGTKSKVGLSLTIRQKLPS